MQQQHHQNHTYQGQIWRSLSEIKAFSLLASEMVESDYAALQSTLGAARAEALFTALNAIEDRAKLCHEALDMMETTSALIFG